MIRVCSRCKKVIGEKKPLADKTETHTFCPEYGRKISKEINKYFQKRSQTLLYQVNADNTPKS